MRKYLTGVMQGFSGKRRFLVSFQDGCENGLTSNKLASGTVDSIPFAQEAEVPTMFMIPDEAVDLD